MGRAELEHLKKTGKKKQIVLSKKNVFKLDLIKIGNKGLGYEILKQYEKELKKRFLNGDSYNIILNDGLIKQKNVISIRLVQKPRTLGYIKQQEKRYNKIFTAEEVLKPIIAMKLSTSKQNKLNQIPLHISTQTDFRQQLIKLNKSEYTKFEKQ